MEPMASGSLVAVATPKGEAHDWTILDSTHRECRRCGLRIFLQHDGYGYRFWASLDHNGVPGPAMLSGDAAKCEPPPPAPIAQQVIVEYTGHPDRSPGCERVMHRIPRARGAALLDPSQVRPACKRRFTWWEVGAARDHLGWSWCPKCYPKRSVHFIDPKPGARVVGPVAVDAIMLCGAFRTRHLRATTDPIKVTCERCAAKLGKK